MAEKDFRVQKGLIVNDGDITVPSAHSVFAGIFDTNVAAQGVTLSGITLAADGSDSNIDINITPKGSGEVNITKVDINGGTIDGATIATSDIDMHGKTLDLRDATNVHFDDDQISADAINGGVGIALSDLSVGSEASASGNGAISYASGTGVFTYTPPVDITGNAATFTVANESTDTACNILFTTAATGDLPAKSGTNFVFNSHTGTVRLIGTASSSVGINLKNTHSPGSGSNITGQILKFNAARDGASAGKVNDDLGVIEFHGMSHANNSHLFSHIKTRVTAIDSAGETGSLQFAVSTSTSGGLETVMSINGGVAAASSTVQIHGNLQVDGTTTSVNSTTIELDDKNIELAKGLGNDAAVDGGGITLVSSQGNKTFNWVDARDAWTSSENLELASGKKLIINSNDVLTQTTLGGTVLASSLTSVGTIATGVWNGDAISDTYVANALTVTGGVINGTPIGATSAETGKFTTVNMGGAGSTDGVALLDTSSTAAQSFNCQAGGGVAKTIASYAYGSFRTAKFIGQIHNTSTHHTDCFECLVTYDGDNGPAATSNVHLTTYAYISSNDTPMGTLAAVKSGSNVALQFTNTVADFTGAFAVSTTQLIRQ